MNFHEIVEDVRTASWKSPLNVRMTLMWIRDPGSCLLLCLFAALLTTIHEVISPQYRRL